MYSLLLLLSYFDTICVVFSNKHDFIDYNNVWFLCNTNGNDDNPYKATALEMYPIIASSLWFQPRFYSKDRALSTQL